MTGRESALWKNRRLPWSRVLRAEISHEAAIRWIAEANSFSDLATRYEFLAMSRYCLGFPLGDTHSCLHLAALAFYQRVSENRARTDTDFGGTVAPWITRYIYIALCANNLTLARDLSQQIGDVPAATEKRYPSVRVGHALGAILDNDPAVNDLVRAIRFLPSDWWSASEAQMIRGIANADPSEFLEGLESHLQRHTKLAKRADRDADSELYICVLATGLTILALHRDLVPESDLPESVYLPFQLCRFAECPTDFALAKQFPVSY